MAYSGAFGMSGSGHRTNEQRPLIRVQKKEGILSPILKKLEAIDLENDDLLLLLILYLMYRESGEKDLLITMGALLFG